MVNNRERFLDIKKQLKENKTSICTVPWNHAEIQQNGKVRCVA